MKSAISITAIALGLSLTTMLVVFVFTHIGRSVGQEWGSMNGTAPAWPAAIGFGSMNLALLSGAVLVTLASVAIGREAARSGRKARQ